MPNEPTVDGPERAAAGPAISRPLRAVDLPARLRSHRPGRRPGRLRSHRRSARYARSVTVGTHRRDDAPDTATRRPTGLCVGAGHIVRYGNAAFRDQFGDGAVGIPAREGLVGMPPEAFALLDAVLERGRPLARWIARPSGRWRMIAAPRRDPGTGEVYGVAFHLRSAGDPL